MELTINSKIMTVRCGSAAPMVTVGKPDGGKLDVPLYGGIGLSVLAVIPFLAAWRADSIAANVLNGRRSRRWHASCFVAALRTWLIAALVVGWLAVSLHLKWITSVVAIVVGVALVLGIVAGAVFTPY